jgi:predicted secreted protein
MAQQNITPNRPPLVWSTIDEAFQKINSNFSEIYLTILENGITPVDLTSIASSIIPDNNALRNLGSTTKKWNEIWATELNLGAATITSTDGILDLPEGATVNGELIRNPDESSFKTVRVSGQADVVADNFQSVLNLVGNGITVTTNAETDTITFNNAGVIGAVAGTGIGVSGSTGNVTFTNTGVTSITSGSGISVSAGTGGVTISNSGVRSLIAGDNITLNNDNGIVTVTNGAPNVIQNIYRTIAVAGQLQMEATSATTTLNITAAGSGLTILADPTTNTITFNSELGEGGAANRLTSSEEINVTVNNEDSSSYIWSFGQTGNLTLPEDGDILDNNGQSRLVGGGGYSLTRTQLYSVSAGETSAIYYNTTDAQVMKLLITVGRGNDYQGCEMMVVRSGGTEVVVNYSVYGIVHNSAEPLATFSANWVEEESSIVISATNASESDSIWVETMATEVRALGPT